MQKKEDEHSKIKSEADKARKERGDVKEKERKRLDSMKAELAGLTHKLEKLGGKREKLENTVIPDLEGKLKYMEKEIEVEENGLARLEMEEETFRAFTQTPIVEAASPSFPRPRHHSAGERPSPIGRPSSALIHHDPSGSSLNGSINISSGPLWSPTHVHRQQTHGQSQQTHNPRSHSYHNHNTPILLLHPQQQRRGSLKSHITSSTSTPTSTTLASLSSITMTSSPTANSSPTSSTPTRTTAASMLSSRAPVFERSKNVMAASHRESSGQSQFHGGSSTPCASPILIIDGLDECEGEEFQETDHNLQQLTHHLQFTCSSRKTVQVMLKHAVEPREGMGTVRVRGAGGERGRW
jgi:hypothetical protein